MFSFLVEKCQFNCSVISRYCFNDIHACCLPCLHCDSMIKSAARLHTGWYINFTCSLVLVVSVSVPPIRSERQDREAEWRGSCRRSSEPGGQDVWKPGEERLSVGSGAEGAGEPPVSEPQVPGSCCLLQQSHREWGQSDGEQLQAAVCLRQK